MAVNDTETAAPAQTVNTAQARPASGGFSFSNPLTFAPLSAGVGSNYYIKLKEMLTKLFKEVNSEIEISLLDMDKDKEPALAFSAMVIALRFKSRQDLGVAYHTLLLEATGDKLNPIYDNINGQQVEITRATSDAFDEVLMTKVVERVRRAFPNVPLRNAAGCVVPDTLNPEDEAAVKPLAANAGLACVADLDANDDSIPPLNMANLQHDSQLVIDIKFDRQTMVDQVSLPVRSDVLINFSSHRNTGNNKYASPNSGDRETKVSQVTGFLDAVWNPLTPSGLGQQYMNPMQLAAQTQKYVPRLILTNLTSNWSQSTEMMLLALATSLTLRDDNNWIQFFRPVATPGNQVDLSDIGALNIEANVNNDQSANGFGQRIDTKTDNFTLTDLGRLVSILFQPGLIVSLDCPEVGAQSHYLDVFAAASNGNQNAYSMLYAAANNLTNGRFQHYFPNGSPMFVDQNNRIHLGYYTDASGAKRDLRSIDHIAVANLTGDRNPQVIRDWSDTFLRTNYPLPQRLAARKKMIQGLTGETAVFKGFAQRVTFSVQFLEAINKGIRETGLSVRVNTPLSASDFNNQRGVAGFAQAAMLGQGQTFLQSSVGGWQPNAFHMGNAGGYRF